MRSYLAVACLALAACAADEPYFQSVLTPQDTADTLGPYRVEARVVADRGVFRLLVVFAAAAGVAVPPDLPLELIDGDEREGLWSAELPGRPAGSVYRFQLKLIDTDGAKVLYPQIDGDAFLEFRIVEEIGLTSN